MDMWALIWSLLFFLSFTISNSFLDDLQLMENPQITYTYTRFPEVEKHCASILSSASELEPNDNRGDRLKKEFFFINGDWEQEPGGAPLMPFEMGTNYFHYDIGAPFKLVSMWIMDVDPIRRAKNAVSVSVAMEIGITRTTSFAYKPYDWGPNFDMTQGTSKLRILFEGVYVESIENGGQSFLCLLGNTTMPSQSQPTDSSELELRLNYNIRPPTILDDQIMLVLRYPKSLTLTTRGITGEMKSLHQRWSGTYFDKVHIYAQWGRYAKYNFGSGELMSKACSPFPCADSILEGDEIFKGDKYCEKLQDFSWNEVFELRPSKKDFDNVGYLKKVGPFILGRDLDTTYANLSNLRLMIQHLNCEAGADENGTMTAKVSAVLRVISSSENYRREETRTGLPGRRLSVEGIWHASDGQLCMIGCLELLDASSDRCSSRICLYFPLVMSIKQQNVMFGSIMSIKGTESYSSIIFHKAATPETFLYRYQTNTQLPWSYEYSKIVEAREFQQRSKPSKISIFLRKTIFWYPSSKGSTIADFSFLADVFSFKSSAAPQTRPNGQNSKINVEINTLSIGSFFGRSFQRSDQERLQAEKAFHSPRETIEISGHLRISGEQFHNISLLFEGLYDPIVGEMYLIGCRNVHNIQMLVASGTKLEEWEYCQIEIKVKFSPKNARWLLNPRIKFSIQSKRSKKDPLYLSPVNLDTFVLSYTKKMEDVSFRRGFEEVLRLTMLIFAVICILNQLRYAEKVGHPIADISLIMLGVHVLGFSIPLITRSKVLFKWKEFTPYRTQNYKSEKVHVFKILESCVNTLLLLGLLSTMKLVDKVCESRKKQLDQGKRLNPRIPRDKIIFGITFLIHAIAFFMFYVLRKVYASQIFAQYAKAYFQIRRQWWNEMANYAELVQDLFLLPQIIGNVMGNVRGKPLRKLYYIGITIIRLLINAYDYVRDPVPNTLHNDEEFQYLGFESYVKIGNIAVALAILVLAMILYLQQESSCQKCSEQKELEKCEDLASKTDLYSRLLSE